MKKLKISLVFCLFVAILSYASNDCKGIRLISQDGGVLFGRTMEWGTFDLRSRINIVPTGYAYRGTTPDGQVGKVYKAKYGFVGLEILYI